MSFNIKIPFVIASHIKKYSASSALKNKAKAAAFGVVNNVPMYHDGTSAVEVGNAIAITNVGAKAGATVSVLERGNALLHRTILTLTALPLTLIDLAQGAGVKIYRFPLGGVTILGAMGTVAETTTSVLATTLNPSVTYNYGVGTTTQANGTLATTEQDLLTVSNGTASATINVPGATTANKGRTAAPAAFDGNVTAIDAFFNVGIAIATDIDGDATTLWTGTIVLDWLFGSLDIS